MESYLNLMAKKEKYLGKTVKFVSEICFKWGFSGKKSAIDEIARMLARAGYDVNYKVIANTKVVGIYNIILTLDNGKQVVVYSNKTKDEGAIIDKNPLYKSQEIINKISELIWVNIIGFNDKIFRNIFYFVNDPN